MINSSPIPPANRPQNSFDLWELLKKFFFIFIFFQIFFSMTPRIKKAYQDSVSPKLKISLIDLSGEITASHHLIKEIRDAANKPEIKGIMLRVNSGGGYAGTSELIYRELLRAKEKKPVVALIENTCASGAYNVAISANKIISPQNSMVGSIGVFYPTFSGKRLAEKLNIDLDSVYKGDFKMAGNPLAEKMDEKQKKHIQEAVDSSYDIFVSQVAKERNLEVKDHKVWADGRIFTGEQALKIGLIDLIGDLATAEEEMKKLTYEPEKDVEFVRYPKPSALAGLLSGSSEDDEKSVPQGISSLYFKRALTYFVDFFVQEIM